MDLVKSPDLAYVMCNLTVGDGGVYTWQEKCKNSKNGVRTCYQVSMSCIDKEYIDAVNEKVCRLLNKKRLMTVGLLHTSKYREGNSDIWRVRISCSQEFYEWVKSRSDEFLMDLWQTYPKEFLQSWFNSDGSIVYRNGGGLVLEITNSNKEWLEFAQQLLLEKFDIEIGLYKNQHLKSGKTQWQLATAKRSTIERFYQSVGFGILRKQGILQSYFKY